MLYYVFLSRIVHSFCGVRMIVHDVTLFRKKMGECLPTIKTGIIGPHVRTLELPLLVWSVVYCLFIRLSGGLKGGFLAVSPLTQRREF